MLFIKNLFILSQAGGAFGHMLMSYPPALRYQNNPYSGDNIDYSLTTPLSSDGSDFPCRGSLDLLRTPAATAVASWTAGETYNMTITGGAPHNGGSCQASVSLDSGKTFTVIHSYVGGCPAGPESSFKFRLPADTPSSDKALFAWSWHNMVGNREMYMNCAVVKIAGGSGSGKESTPFASRPGIFKADIGNGCSTIPRTNVLFPNPGPDVDINDPAATPATGTCEPAGPGGAGSSGDSSADSGSSDATTTTTVAYVPSGSAATGGPNSTPSSSLDNYTSCRTYVPGNDWPEDMSPASRIAVTGRIAVALLVSHLIMFMW